jgi:hypothetical protein
VVRTSRFKNFLKMNLGRPSASLEITFDRRQELLVRFFDFLPNATVVHHCGGMTRTVLLAFSALRALFGAYGSDAGGGTI